MRIDELVQFVRKAHNRVGQRRRYTGEEYFVHPAEVAAIAAAIHYDYADEIPLHVFLAVAWSHDLFEDTDATRDELADLMKNWPKRDMELYFMGVDRLTDPDSPDLNREQKIALQNDRLAIAPRWIQGLKLCDNFSNIKSIAVHDPDFLCTYLLDKETTLRGFQHDHTAAMAFITPLLEQVKRDIAGHRKCPDCERGRLVYRLKDVQYLDTNGLIMKIADIFGHHCTRCARVEIRELGQVTHRIRKAAARKNSNIHIVDKEEVNVGNATTTISELVPGNGPRR